MQALHSIGSGVDHILNLSELRADIPVLRAVAPSLMQRMREFVAMSVLAWHRQLLGMLQANKAHAWGRFVTPEASQVNVGVLGFGGMGKSVATTLAGLGYSVSAWAQRPREAEGMTYYHGDEQLHEFVAHQDVLICLLPLTERTEGILNSDLPSKVKKGGCLINVGRGGHLVDDALLALLDSGHLSFAFLDVFREEPLSQASLFWQHPNVLVTCHSSSFISNDIGAKLIAQNILDFESGQCTAPLYLREQGY